MKGVLCLRVLMCMHMHVGTVGSPYVFTSLDHPGLYYAGLHIYGGPRRLNFVQALCGTRALEDPRKSTNKCSGRRPRRHFLSHSTCTRLPLWHSPWDSVWPLLLDSGLVLLWKFNMPLVWILHAPVTFHLCLNMRKFKGHSQSEVVLIISM